MDKSHKFKCKICDSEQSAMPIFWLSDKHFVVKCINCRVASIHPTPTETELKEHYSNYYLTRYNQVRESALIDQHSNILEILISNANNNGKLSILDYGFGSGAFLKHASQKELILHGAEISEQNCNQLREHCSEHGSKINIIKLNNENIKLKSTDRFDIITLFQVIEHMTNPIKLLSQLSKYQDSDGILYMECPNNDAKYLKIKNFINKLIGRKFFYDSLKFPEHIFGFSKFTMEIMMKKIGYKIISLGDYHVADGIHQVESMYWWPPIYKLRAFQSIPSFFKSFIWLVDLIFSKFFKSGSGLYVLAKKI